MAQPTTIGLFEMVLEVADLAAAERFYAEDIGLPMQSRNRPSANPRTSRIVAPSIIAALRAMVAPVVVGS